ncbi:hypothetical protein [Sinimarinibacterium flocculans]|uniref:hypothetical protein n=1 Tax=Sinimarinibacterium flocculans TaxID=985250 RepID=UPI00249010B5|nr:hypothetical protein [Sinimarinibacterium flocculans]
MSTAETLERLKREAMSGALSQASSQQLEEYSAALCHPQAFSHFGAHEFPQVCEAVRIHLLRAHIEKLQNHITLLDAKNTRLSWWVIALAAMALITGLAQIAVASLPYTELLQPPASAPLQQQPSSTTSSDERRGSANP